MIIVQAITVKGDQIVTNSTARTRSQKKLEPDQWTTVPALAKILKLLINELKSLKFYDDAANRGEQTKLICQLNVFKMVFLGDSEESTDDDWEDEDEEGDGMNSGAANGRKGMDIMKLLVSLHCNPWAR